MCNKSIDNVIDECSRRLLSIPGVVGVAHGLRDEKDCIKVYVIRKSEDLMKEIPAVIDGYFTDIEETGEFTIS